MSDVERASRGERSAVARVVAAWATHPTFIVSHAVWFGGWIAFNTAARHPFDPYPFTLLTMIVALEAIMLTAFVLMAQDRMTKAADRREQLHLQINLLAEQELTAILRAVCLLGTEAGVDLKRHIPEIEALQQPTDVQKIAAALERHEKREGSSSA